jgi:transcriptional regulator with GAF, ATPase, and Fis domain
MLIQEKDLLHSQYQALLQISEAIASQRDLAQLFHDLPPRLHPVVQFDLINLILHDPARNMMKSHVLEAPDPALTCPAQECPMETPGGWVWQTQQPWVVSRLDADTRFPGMCTWLHDRGLRSLCVLPVTTALRRLGALALGSAQEAAYSDTDVLFLQQVARQVAVAVDNALNFERAQSVQQQLKEERDRLSTLLEVNNAVVSTLDLRELLNAVSASLRRLVPHEYASLSLYDAETQRLQIHALDFPVSKGLLQEGLSVPVHGSPTGRALTSRQPVFITRREAEQFGSDMARRILAEGLTSALCLPLISHSRPLGTLVVASLREETFPQRDAELLHNVANQIAIAVENALAFGQVVDRAKKLTEEKLYLLDEIRTEYNFEEIIGESPALKGILEQVQTVAPTDSTVLILGETGTGKELIARAIHNHSRRRDRALVTVNCGAISAGLVESELFGHEKGAFTGALQRKVGRFELADGGSIFLDEIGDLPLDLQVKLLRVLQEGEVRRVGENLPRRVDVRIVAATNRRLEQETAGGRFRTDLPPVDAGKLEGRQRGGRVAPVVLARHVQLAVVRLEGAAPDRTRHALQPALEELGDLRAGGELAVMVEVDVRHDADLRAQELDRPVRLVALDDEPARAGARVGAQLWNLSADQEPGIAAQPVEDERDHRGGRRLPVRAGDDDRGLERDELGEELRPRPARRTACERGGDDRLGVCRRIRLRRDADGDLVREMGEVRRLVPVPTGDVGAPSVRQERVSREPCAAEPDEVQLTNRERLQAR